jgi:hypothetical protein
VDSGKTDIASCPLKKGSFAVLNPEPAGEQGNERSDVLTWGQGKGLPPIAIQIFQGFPQ